MSRENTSHLLWPRPLGWARAFRGVGRREAQPHILPKGLRAKSGCPRLEAADPSLPGRVPGRALLLLRRLPGHVPAH